MRGWIAGVALAALAGGMAGCSVPAGLRAGCQGLERGDSAATAVRLLPARAYRRGCCADEPCGSAPPCRSLETEAGRLLYNCDEEGDPCPFLWRAGSAQCVVLMDLKRGRVLDAELTELPL